MSFQSRFGASFGKNNRAIQVAHRALTEAELRAYAPSVFATEAHESRSERYTYIPTIEAIRGLEREGFVPTFATQARCRIPGKSDFTKHMLRFRMLANTALTGECKEVIMINSHDGTSRYVLTAGVFRFICLNGTIVGETFEQLKVGHKGDIVRDVIDGTFEVVEQFGKVDQSIEEMKQIRLDREETQLLGETALAIRFPDRVAPITPAQINAPRRQEDTSPDLWTSFQRIQENAIRGGIEGRVLNPETNRWGRRTTRPIQGVNDLVGVNRALWTMAERFAELKKAA